MERIAPPTWHAGLVSSSRVAVANGHALPNDVIDQNIQRTRKTPAYKTSMALKFENGRPMEVEAILGNTVRAGNVNELSCRRCTPC